MRSFCPAPCYTSEFSDVHALAETQHFINLLFNALRSKSYLPYNTSPPPTPAQSYNNSNPSADHLNNAGIPIPLDALIAGQGNPPFNPRKRGLEDPSDDREYRKGPRLSNDQGYPRHGRGGRGHWDGRGAARGRDGGHGDPSGQYGGNRPQQYRPPDQAKRGICRDYHSELLPMRVYMHTLINVQIMAIAREEPFASIRTGKTRSCLRS